MRDELRQSFALLPRSSDSWTWITKPTKSSIEEFIGGRGAPTRTLSIEGPAKNQLRRTIALSSHPSQPMVDECGLSDTAPSNDCNDADVLVTPSTIQKSNILLATENIASCNGQSGY